MINYAMALVASMVLVVVGLNFISCHYPKHPEIHAPYNHHHHFNPYSYGYDVEDHYGNKQWRQERSHNPQEVHGSYGYRDNNGIYREVVYVADKNGFRANIKTNEPGTDSSKSPAGVKLESYYPTPSGIYAKYLAAAPVPLYPAASSSMASTASLTGQHQQPQATSATSSASATVHQVPVYASQLQMHPTLAY